ncbi:ATPase [Campylobacter sp. RM16190]|uniref:ATPase n=1 Tax=Campylobacter sp. RM16190 TaxID=1705727 RepID=UPI001475C2FD|nr:ATPase [Campylobacter sp. RM16190]
MEQERLIELFSAKRLSSYKSEGEHRDNFILMQILSPKLGILEIITRNKIAKILNIKDDDFISKQSLGYWVKTMDEARIHNQIMDLNDIDFRRYSEFNINTKLRNYQKVSVAYILLRLIRNRAFHFENLYKLNDSGTPRVSACKEFGKTRVIIGINPNMIETFINDLLACFGDDVRGYL